MTITDEERHKIKASIRQKLEHLEDDLLKAKESSKPVTLDQQAFGRVSRIDAIQQQQMAVAMVSGLENTKKLLQRALGRIDHEDFGVCLKCDEPIELKRLTARPESPICVRCASELP